jgi:hypothetical protein
MNQTGRKVKIRKKISCRSYRERERRKPEGKLNSRCWQWNSKREVEQRHKGKRKKKRKHKGRRQKKTVFGKNKRRLAS